MAFDLAYDVGRVACRMREGTLCCTREVLQVGPWRVPLGEVTAVRCSPRLRFVEISTRRGTRRFYAPMDPGGHEEFALLELFLARAVRGSVRNPRLAATVPPRGPAGRS